MNLDFIEIPTSSTKPKATIHITGKLGFNTEAVKYMDIDEHTYYRIALDKDASEKKDLYFVLSSKDEQGAVKISKSGQYFYINLSSLFNRMGLEYEKHTIVFDITKAEYNGKKMFIFGKRKKEILRDKKNNDSKNEEIDSDSDK